MASAQARTLREAGMRTGMAVILQTPRILDMVQSAIDPQDLEHVDVLIRVMAGFDRDTAEHLEAVGTMSMLLAHRADFGMATMGNCLLAGRVHDIGKLAISRTILLKPSRPSKDEWEELKMHPSYGSSTLAGLPRLKHLAPFVMAHHERIDGLGYPLGLNASEIPVEAQIVAIADAFCAMTVPRPYCRTMLPNEALVELERCAGTQFAPDLVAHFVSMFREPHVSAVNDAG